MSAEALRLLAGEAPAPVTLDGAAVAGLIAAAHDAGARVAELRAPATKTALFDAISAGLRYPDWWGRNWDALSELLHFPDPAPAPAEPAPEPATDPAPAPPPSSLSRRASDGAIPEVIVWHDPAVLAEADPRAWDVVREILREAIADRRSRSAAALVVALTGDLPADVVPRSHHAARSDPSAVPPRSATRSATATEAPVAAALAGAAAGTGLPASIRRVGRVHHVAVVVRDLTAALRFWRDILGLAPGPVVPIPTDRVNIAFLPVGEVKIELVEPTDETTGVARFLASRGEGFHHVCFEVPDIHAALTRLALDGIELIDGAPRSGAEGPVAFLHPRSCHGVLVELIEKEGGPAWSAFYPAGFRAPGS